MATYAKVLKDTSGNQILPYTRAKLVYMDNNVSVQTAISNIQNQGGYTLPTASSSTLGGVKIGSNLSISSGVLSVNTGSSTSKGVLSVGSNITVSSGQISLTKNNITSALGYTPPTTDTKYTLPTASSSTLGGVKIGSNISISSGTISVKTATTSALGVVKIGSNISVSSGTISVPDANVNEKGVVTIWRSIENGYNDDRVPTMNAVYTYVHSKDVTDGYHNIRTPSAEGIDVTHGETANHMTTVGVDHCIIAGEHHPLGAIKSGGGGINFGYTAPHTADGAIIGGYYSSSSYVENEDKIFTLGNGSSSTASNCFYIATNGNVHASGNVTSSNGADYAEYFEWEDSNINNEDRRGLFVTLNGDKIKLASKDDTYILGIISGNPTVIGDSADLYWKDQYKRDIYGSCIHSEDTYNHLVLNPDYDPDKEYIPRSDRKEWDPVGLTGKLICIDDGTCEVNGYCYPSTNGIGTKSDHGYRVMKRIDNTHIQVLVR